MKAVPDATYTTAWIKTLGIYMPRQQIKGKVREGVGPSFSQHAVQLSEIEQEKAGLLGARHRANKRAPLLSKAERDERVERERARRRERERERRERRERER